MLDPLSEMKCPPVSMARRERLAGGPDLQQEISPMNATLERIWYPDAP
jgi:hypothetical protein